MKKHMLSLVAACAASVGVCGYVQKWRGLPSGYTQVEYIESTGSQYIDTGIAPDTTTAVDFTFNLVQSVDNKAFFGQGWNGNRFLFNQQSSQFKFHGGGNLSGDLSSSYGNVIAGNDYRCQIEPTESNNGTLTLTWGGVTRSCTVVLSVDAGKQLRIFGSNENKDHLSKIRVYGMKIWKGSELVADLVPAIDGEGKGGLYNLIGEGSNWLANGGTDAFKVGAAVPDPAPDGFTPILTATGARRIYRAGAYEVYEWTDTGDGNGFTVPEGGVVADILLVGGGGAGGMTRGGGGGGGGVIYTNTLDLAAGSYTVSVGAGGIPQYNASAYQSKDNNGEIYNKGITPDTATGGNSSVIGGLVELVAFGGGGGGCFNYGSGDQANSAGLAGGCGGGAGGHNEKEISGGAGTEGQGFAGANNAKPSSGGGGGGGAGGVGALPDGSKAGDGGSGKVIDITGVEMCYGGGGGGGGYAVTYGIGGAGGGGDGNYDKHGPLLSQNGVDGLGGGGGGGGAKNNNGWYGVGGVGGSGTVVVRVLLQGMIGVVAGVDNSKARELGLTVTVNASDDQPTDTFDVFAAIGSSATEPGEFGLVAENVALNTAITKIFGGLDANAEYCVSLKVQNRNSQEWSEVWQRTVTTSPAVYPFVAAGPAIVKTADDYEVSLVVVSVQDDAQNVTATLNGVTKSVTGPGVYTWQVPASGDGCSATVTLACTAQGFPYSRDYSASVSGDAVIVPVADPSAHASAATALKLHVGDGILLPPSEGSSYTILNQSFMSQDGDIATAIKPGIVGIECRAADGTVTTIAVIVLPEKIGSGNIYIRADTSSQDWHSSANWLTVDGVVAADYPHSVDDIAIIPRYSNAQYFKVKEDIALGGLYVGIIKSGIDGKYYIQRADGVKTIPVVSFKRSDGEPVMIQACGNNQDAANGRRTTIQFGDSNNKLGFKYETDTVFDGGWDGVNANCASGRPAYASNCTNEIPVGVTLVFKNIDTTGTDASCTFAAPALKGEGVFWNRSGANIRFESSRQSDLFTGIIRDSAHGNQQIWRSGPSNFYSAAVTNASAEAYGYVANSSGSPGANTSGAGMICTGHDHSHANPGAHPWINWLPARGMTLVNSTYFCGSTELSSYGVGVAEYKYTAVTTIGRGFSYIFRNSNRLNKDGHPVNWFETDVLAHQDKGTIRIDDYYRSKYTDPANTTNNVTILHGFKSLALGGNGDPKASENYPIIPWMVTPSKNTDSEKLAFTCVDGNDRICDMATRTNRALDEIVDEYENAYVKDKSVALTSDRTMNTLWLYNANKEKKLGAEKTLTIASGGLILRADNSAIGTKDGGEANGALVLGDAASPGYVFADATDASKPGAIYAKVTAKGGLVFGYTGYALLAGDQTGVDDELVVNAGTLDLGSQDKTVACTLDVPVRILANATVKMNNAEISNSAIYFDDIAGYSGKVQLNADTTCKKLYVRDTPEESEWTELRRGTYGATGSGAANIDDDHFTGTGVLMVKGNGPVGIKLILR